MSFAYSLTSIERNNRAYGINKVGLERKGFTLKSSNNSAPLTSCCKAQAQHFGCAFRYSREGSLRRIRRKGRLSCRFHREKRARRNQVKSDRISTMAFPLPRCSPDRKRILLLRTEQLPLDLYRSRLSCRQHHLLTSRHVGLWRGGGISSSEDGQHWQVKHHVDGGALLLGIRFASDTFADMHLAPGALS